MQALKVLVIDDDPQDYTLICEHLRCSRRSTLSATHASSYAQACEAINADGYDIYLIDYYLGDHNALDVIHHAKEIGCQCPLIVITGANQRELDEQVIKAGADDYLPKGELTPTLLERTIFHALERKATEEKLLKLVKQDGLTGLGNRSFFEDQLDRMVSKARREGGCLAVIFFDLDRFKEVNDTLGHHVGDLLLNLVAQRLLSQIRKEDVVARIGGDEFTILLSSISTMKDAAQVAEKILDCMSLPTPLNGKSLVVAASMGIALFPDCATTPIELMQCADMALNLAKESGRHNYKFFTRELKVRLENELRIEAELRDAIKRWQLRLYYQPIVRLRDGHLVGFEALLRWHHPELNAIAPMQFIPIAEKTGLIVPLGNWVLEQACNQHNMWRKRYKNRFNMAINVSPIQLRGTSFSADLTDMIAEIGIPPDEIDIEITEDVFMDRTHQSVLHLQHLYDSGFNIVVDDFGTGYSSLSYLKDLPVSSLKVDRSFISARDQDVAEKSIVSSIISLAHSMGLCVVAEGVETACQRDYLCAQHCEYAQGYFFSAPLSVEDATHYLDCRDAKSY